MLLFAGRGAVRDPAAEIGEMVIFDRPFCRGLSLFVDRELLKFCRVTLHVGSLIDLTDWYDCILYTGPGAANADADPNSQGVVRS